MSEPDDTGLETLLDLDGITYRLNEGYWVKFEVHSVDATEHRPHGISYSLTLHDRTNARVVGFDNAHGSLAPRRKRFAGRKIAWDHRHHSERIVPYEYESAAQLIQDFWDEVERIIGGDKP
jgi:hypothetical protein